MEEKKLDILIRNTLFHKSGEAQVPSGLREKIRQDIRKQEEEAHHMTHFSIRKAMAVAAAICIMGTIAAVAGGKATMLVSSSSKTDNQYPTFSSLPEAESKLGYEVKAVDSFSNGFSYLKGNVNTVEARDDQGNTVGSYSELWIRYRNQDAKELSLIINKPLEMAGTGGIAKKSTRKIGGMTVDYYHDEYRFLPPDAQASEEDLEAEERGELYISYGSDTEETVYSSHVDWVDQGVHYSLLFMDDMSEEEMYAMAGEVISAK